MTLKELQDLSIARRKILPFVRSLEDSDLLVAIGAANEAGSYLGLKQLQLLNIASPSTVHRRLRTLVAVRAIERSLLKGDGRRVVYNLTPKARAAFKVYISQLRNIG